MTQKNYARTRFLPFLVKYLFPLLLIFGLNVSPSKAQGEAFWSSQERIPDYPDSIEEPPFLIGDTNHTVHAFNSQPLNLDDSNSPSAIFYRQWSLDNGWTYPNDILIDTEGAGLVLLGTAYDSSGLARLIYQRNGEIFYTQNYLVDANNATSWSDPIKIADSSERSRPGVINVAAMGASQDGSEIVVIYSGNQDGNGLYFTNSSDGGNSWTEPYPIYLTGDETIIVTDPKIYADEAGMFHVVWSTFLDDGSAGPGFYTNFDPKTKVWRDVSELDMPGIRTPSIFEKDGDLFVSYYHQNVNGNWWRRSSDNGNTWSLPEQISPQHVGTNGSVSFVVDGANTLHAFFGERIDDNNHGMWHVNFTGATWANLEAVVRGPQIRDGLGGNGFDPRSARAVIVNGNTVLVTWATDGAGGLNGAWFSYKRLDAPELPSIPLESPTLTANVTGNNLAVPTPTYTASETPPEANHPNFSTTPEFGQNPQNSIFVGVIPVVLLLAGIVVVFYIFQNKK